MTSPSCPRCGYDLSGETSRWALAAPLELRCPECGTAFRSGDAFEVDAGPAWSFEHARRRLMSRWFRTTLMTLRPSRLWREYRVEQPIRLRRLAWLAATWLGVLHLTTLAVVGVSAWVVQLSPLYGWWPALDWAFWRSVLWRVAWPYGGWIEIPITSNSAVANPAYEFVEMALFPHAAMALLMLAWARPLRRRTLSRLHILRAAALCLPVATLVFLAITSAFVFLSMVEDSPAMGMDVFRATVMALLFLNVMAALILWWRCFAVEYLGCRRRTWTLVPLGVLALVLTWIASFALEDALRR